MSQLRWSDIERYEFDLPPVDEQRRIAALLWAVERHRRAVEDLNDVTQRTYEQARLALLTTGPRAAWTKAEVGPDRVHRWTERVPEGWTAETVSSVGRVRSGATPNRSEQKRYFDHGGTPWVKALDLNEGILMTTDERITAAAVAETSAKVVPAGTVLVAMYGGFAQIGRTARLGVDAATNQAVSAVLDLRDDVDPVFLHEVLKAGRPRWRKVAASTRKDPNITKKDVEAFDFPLPSPEEQVAILAALSRIQQAINASTEEFGILNALHASLLADVFGGN